MLNETEVKLYYGNFYIGWRYDAYFAHFATSTCMLRYQRPRTKTTHIVKEERFQNDVCFIFDGKFYSVLQY